MNIFKIIDKIKIKTKRLNLGGWSELENIRLKIQSSYENGFYGEVSALIYNYLDMVTLFRLPRWIPWYVAANTYIQAILANQPRKKFPILETEEKNSKEQPWDYPERTLYFWLNILAKNYGWSMSDIRKMDIDDAIGLYQEIMVSEQFDREWEWGLSEIAYPYDKNTKKSKYQPLDRPKWMKPIMTKKKPLPKTKILRAFMPQGNVVSLVKDED